MTGRPDGLGLFQNRAGVTAGRGLLRNLLRLLPWGWRHGGNMRETQSELLVELVQTGRITQVQADAFTDIHARLLDAGLME